MSALPPAEEIKLNIKVKKGWSEEELQQKFKECVKKYPQYDASSSLIWFLVAKDLKVPVAISRGSASRPAVDLPPKEDYIHLVDFNTEKHFLFNARGYVLDKWAVTTAPKMRGFILLADGTRIEKTAVFVEQEDWFNSVDIGESFHFRGLGFMPENTDKEGKTWPRTIRMGFRTEIEAIEEGDYELPPITNQAISIPELEHILEDEVVLIRGIIIDALKEDAYVSCTRCYKGTGQEEGVQVKCEKCDTFVKGTYRKRWALVVEDVYEKPVRVRFPPWFKPPEGVDMETGEMLILGTYNARYKYFDGSSIIPPTGKPKEETKKEEVKDDSGLQDALKKYSPQHVADCIDFSRDKEEGMKPLSPEKIKEYADIIEDTFPDIMLSLGGQTGEEFSSLVELKWADRVQTEELVRFLIDKGTLTVRKEKEDTEPKLYWVEQASGED